jgi:NAD(P)-dependent dehydrogenase (short-subunit alcohol dehydrogenase family)
MEGKTCMVTGANTGVGLETARELARFGATVVMTARDAERGETAVKEVQQETGSQQVHLLLLDLASPKSIGEAVRQFNERFDALHVLINNAGVLLSHRQETPEGVEMTLAVNHLGPFLLTLLLLERIRSSVPARIINVSSEAHRKAWGGFNFDDLHSRRRYLPFMVYARTKLANILFTRELARRLEGTRVTVNAVHPGLVHSGLGADGDTTGLFRFGMHLIRPFMISPQRGARTSVYLARSPKVEGVTGRYFVRCKEVRTTRAARDDDAAQRLWAISEQLTGVHLGGDNAPAGAEPG